MKIREWHWLTSLVTLGWCCSASAQTAASTAGSDAGANDSLQTVVVTAERRQQDLQVTPLAVTVLTGAQLADSGVVSIDSLQFITPGATVNNFGQGNDFDIRGVGKGEHNSQTTVGVVTYRDGVATFPGYYQEEPYYDVANIEILRGPQGTFGGQNATGGAVFVTTVDPKIGGGYEGYVQAQVGNFSDYGFTGGVNLPISDTLAARFAFNTEDRDSFYHVTGPNGGPYTGDPGNVREYSGRFGLLWKPSDALSVLLKFDASYLDFGAYPADPYNATEDLFHVGVDAPQKALDRFARGSLKVDYLLANGVTLRSITGYQRARGEYAGDLDGTNGTLNGAPYNNASFEGFPYYSPEYFQDQVSESMWSEELNVISPDKGPLTWIFGAIANDNYNYFLSPYQFIIGVPLGNPLSEYVLQGSNPVPSEAVFGQMGYMLTPTFQIQLGARYSASKTSNNVQIIQYGLPLTDNQEAKFVNTSGKLSFNWSLTPNNFLYTFVSTGFRPGGLNVPVGLGTPAAFGAEKLTDYELGWKTTAFDGHLRTQIDGFYDIYRNFQVTVGYPQIPTFGFELNNPNATHLYGFEAQTQAVFGNLSFDAGTTIMHSSLGRFFATDPRVASVTACDPSSGPSSTSCIDLDGKSQTYAPNFTINFGGEYRFILAPQDNLTPRIDFGYVAPQWATLFENSSFGDRLSGRGILNAQIAWKHNSFVTTIYGSNLRDQHYEGALNSGLRFAGPPRQFGVRVLLAF